MREFNQPYANGSRQLKNMGTGNTTEQNNTETEAEYSFVYHPAVSVECTSCLCLCSSMCGDHERMCEIVLGVVSCGTSVRASSGIRWQNAPTDTQVHFPIKIVLCIW